MPDLNGKRAVVMGLGVHGGGLGVARYLAARGADVLVTDLKSPAELRRPLAELADAPVELRLGEHRESDFFSADLVVVNPAVPPRSPFIAAARRGRARIVTEIGLFLDICPARIIAITGTNGKTTSTALAAHLLESPSRRAFRGGNMGGSLLEAAPGMSSQDVVVLELSSFQLARLDALKVQAAAITNLSPNHLDWHPSMEHYRRCKASLARAVVPGGVLALFHDDEVRHMGAPADPRTHFFSLSRTMERGAFLRDECIVLAGIEPEGPLLAASESPLLGRFNLANAMAALLICARFEADARVLRERLRSFTPVAHRLEPIIPGADVLCVNDSKATTPAATAAALFALERPVILVAGGYDKGTGFAALAEPAGRWCRRAMLVGATARELGAVLETAGTPVEYFDDDFDGAVERAVEEARGEEAVLLSPACASWGMFTDFAQRGERFRELCRRLLADGSRRTHPAA